MDSFIPSRALAEKIAAEFGMPAFVIDAATLRQKAQAMLAAFDWPKTKILYAIKANFNPAIVKVLKVAGIHGIDTVSINEVRLALQLGFAPENIVFTGAHPSDDDMRFVTEQNVIVNAGSLSEIKRFGKMFPGKAIAIRINPGVGDALFASNVTGGEKSAFGIIHSNFAAAKELLKKYNLRLAGIHSHIGSGFYSTDKFIESVKIVLAEAAEFPELQFVDFGGGFCVPYKPEEPAIDLAEFGRQVKNLLKDFSEKNGRQIEMRLEPGRFLVAESTALLTTVTTRKQGAKQLFIGTDTGMNHLIRPAMYGSYHHIVNISNPEGEKEVVSITGNICESADFFAKDREIAAPREGDLLAILTAGAYGNTMSSNYNLQPLAAEVMVDKDEIKLTRKRQSYEQMMENFVF